MHAEREKRDELQKKLTHEKNDAVSRARKEENARLTKLIPKDEYHRDNVCYPLGKPEHPMYVVAEPMNVACSFEEYARQPYFLDRLETHKFRVTQHGLRLPNGLQVIWFGLELCR